MDRGSIGRYLGYVKWPKSYGIETLEGYKEFLRLNVVSVVYFGVGFGDEGYRRFLKYRGLFPEYKFGHVFGKGLRSLIGGKVADGKDGKDGMVLVVSKVGGMREVVYEKSFVKNEEAFVGWLGGFRWLEQSDFNLGLFHTGERISTGREKFLVLFLEGIGVYDFHDLHLFGNLGDGHVTHEENEIMVEQNFLLFQNWVYKLPEKSFQTAIGSMKHPLVNRLMLKMKVGMPGDLPIVLYTWWSNKWNTFVKYKVPLELLAHDRYQDLLKLIHAIDENEGGQDLRGYRYYLGNPEKALVRKFETGIGVYELSSYNLAEFVRKFETGIVVILFMKASCPYAMRALAQLEDIFVNQSRVFEGQTIEFGIFDVARNEIPADDDTQVLYSHAHNTHQKLAIFTESNYHSQWREFDLQEFETTVVLEHLAILST
jgi:hypothetical protein